MEAWLPALLQGETDAAWDQFLTRYRRLIFAAIRHYARDHDDGMDVFAQLCGRLRADDMRRLRERAEDPDPQSQFSTWLVAVVRNQAIDWIRQRDGRRPRAAAWQQLPELQQRIVELVVLDRMGHAAAFETLRSGGHPDLTFREFQRELRTLPMPQQFLLDVLQRMATHDHINRTIGPQHQQPRRFPSSRQP